MNKKELSLTSKYLISTVLLLILLVTFPILGNASTDLTSSGLIDDFTFQPDTINDAEKTTVKIDFSEKNGIKIKSGDTMTLPLPNTGELTLTGFKTTIELKNSDGLVFGIAEVNDGEVNVTFNETADKLENIKGYFSFQVQGRNFQGDNTEANTGVIDWNFNSQLPNKAVTIYRGESGTTSVFYYKTGDMVPSDTEHVRWFLNLNPEKK